MKCSSPSAGCSQKITYTAAQSEQAFVAARLADSLSSIERDYPAVLAQVLTW